MKRITAAICAVLYSVAFPAHSEPKIPRIETTEGKVYLECTIREFEDGKLRIFYKDGAIGIPYAELPQDLKMRFKKEYDKSLEFDQQESDHQKLQGTWKLTNARSGGKEGLDRSPSHQSWQIDGDMITLNGNRQLWFRLNQKTTPRRLFISNRVGGRIVPVYACIYTLKDDVLTVCVNAGETPPNSFTAGADDIYFLLKFRRAAR